MARKKVVLVIVEGVSDDTALGIALSQIYDKDSVYIHIMHGDITAQKGINPQNIIGKIGNDVRLYAKSQHYTAKHFKQIIHIVDTDGAYIPDDRVINNQDFQNPLYESDGIYTKDVNGSYSNSWKHIEKDSNSIERYTNLSICIEEEINHCMVI